MQHVQDHALDAGQPVAHIRDRFVGSFSHKYSFDLP
jgi:hypothetical protein